ncbi:hypothetical protein TDB9533_03449 [Thalassocella blandensis]|nr:hypothetical protein TDB9533_03449 [Thalassocella blandensis]
MNSSSSQSPGPDSSSNCHTKNARADISTAHTHHQQILEVFTIGHCATPVIQIDHFHPEPNTLIDAAMRDQAFQHNPKDFYPGVRKPFADAAYQQWLISSIRDSVNQLFPQLHDAKPIELNSVFSITSTPVKKLRPIQTIPHIDTHDAVSFACVHYLCHPPFTGTSFYRHISTSLERISDKDLKTYFATAKQELMSREFTPQYCDDSSEFFQRIHRCPLQFNRLIFYPANLLHSGDIQEKLMNNGSPENDRLTLNTFVKFGTNE